MSDAPVVLCRADSPDARHAAEQIRRRWTGAELVAWADDTTLPQATSGDVWQLGLSGQIIRYVGLSPGPKTRLIVINPTPDASIAMQVWRRLNPAGEGKPKIRDARKAAGLTMGDLARKAGVSVQTISSWERGKTGPGLAELTTLAAALGVKAPHLRGDTPHPPTWLRYLDDAVCGRWEMEGSDAVWAWVESFEPAEAVAVLFAMPDEEHPEWGVVARIGGAILRDRGRREEGHDAAIDVWRRQADGFRVERDGLQAESETRRGALDTALAGWYEQHGDGCPTCSFAGKMNEPGHDNGCTWSALQAHAEAGP